MSLGPHVRVDGETHETLQFVQLITKQSYPEMMVDAVAALLASNPKLKTKVEAMKKAAAA